MSTEPTAGELRRQREELLAKVKQADLILLQEQVAKITLLHKERRAAFDKTAESLKAEGRALINVAKEEAEVIVQDAKNRADSILAGAAEETKLWVAEKTALAGVQHFEPNMKLDVGGVRFRTSLTTLCRFPETMIGCMFSGRHAMPLGKDEHFFIDRDGTHFRHILNFLRAPEGYKVEVGGADLRELQRECEYYGIDQLMFPTTEKSLPYRKLCTHLT
ncbi:BTB/POZ protein [Ochromonadaceae sp. CCMP2298]|nr:BTB/POZ protein [Ochromonadaceae sp. CCMP2298]